MSESTYPIHQVSGDRARDLLGRVIKEGMSSPAAQFAVLAFVGLSLRMATFGDPNIYVDESYYLLVGHEMHHGAVPYVDIWDRKPLGLFIAYWFFASFPNSVLAYQIGAWLSASGTAFVLARIANRWLPPSAALTAGLLYLPMLGPLLGMGGQTPVFYNLLVSFAALLVLQYRDDNRDWRLYSAMLLLGLAITFKQPAAFEAAFFGIVAALHHRSPAKTALQILIGAAPFLSIAAWYALAGHWPEFYDAMVTANTSRPTVDPDILLFNAGMLVARLGPLVGAAIYAFAFCPVFPRRFMVLWLAAATAGFLSVPFLVEHYALPMLVPLCIVAAAVVTRRPIGPVLLAVVIVTAVVLAAPFAVSRHKRSAEAFDAMVKAVGPIPAGRFLFIYDGPPLLYHAAGTHPPSVLAFPGHLDNIFEKDVSRIATVPELKRLIAARPYSVVMTTASVVPADRQLHAALIDYARTTCRRVSKINLYGPFAEVSQHVVYSGCNRESK